MKYTPRQYAQSLFKSLDSSKDEDLVLDSFAGLLRDNNDLNLFPIIALEIEKMQLGHKGIKVVEVTLAREADAADKKKIKALLAKWLGQEIEVLTNVRPELLGGIKVKVDDLIWDYSLKGHLQQLRTNLEN